MLNPLSKQSTGDVLRIQYITYIFLIFKSQAQSVPKRRCRN